MKTIYLYRIVCVLTGLVYIGQTVDPKTRWSQHRSRATQTISAEIKRLGAENFIFEVIATCKGKPNAVVLETRLIAQYDSYHNGYNDTESGGAGTEHTPQAKQKITAALIGRPVSQETRDKISASQKGKPRAPLTPEQQAKQKAAASATFKGNRYSAKLTLEEEEEIKNSDLPASTLATQYDITTGPIYRIRKKFGIKRPRHIARGYKVSAKGRANMSKGQRGKKGHPVSEVNKAIISAAQKGKAKSEETKAKISASLTGRPGHPPSQKGLDAFMARNKGNRYNAKLTLEQIEEIKHSKLPGKDLAELYGISVDTIYGYKTKHNKEVREAQKKTTK